MARTLTVYLEPPRECDYDASRVASLEHRVMLHVTPLELEALLVRGWRRFGPVYFRPRCTPCQECVSIRIPVDRFRPDRSMRRAGKACRRFRVAAGPPREDAEHLALYRAWHAARESAKGWEPSPIDREEYTVQFAFPHPAGLELSWRDEAGRLVAVSLNDVTPNAWSAVYFYYHPSIARFSPGIANILQGVEQSRRRGIGHVYLGYRVMPCASMRYKNRFQPHELLVGRPDEEEEPRWVEEKEPPPIPPVSDSAGPD